MSDGQGSKRAFGGLLLVSVVACRAAAAGCSDIQPESNVEEGGVLESPTQEADSLHREEERQEEAPLMPRAR